MSGPSGVHEYLSTACAHRECGSCRKTCKFCSARCMCIHHMGEPAEAVTAWVDQARNVARELLAIAAEPGVPMTPELLGRITEDPGLFWLRGEEMPPGALPDPFH